MRKGRLRDDFVANLSIYADGWCADFLRVDYSDIKARALEGGGTDDEGMLQWAYSHGRHSMKETYVFGTTSSLS